MIRRHVATRLPITVFFLLCGAVPAARAQTTSFVPASISYFTSDDTEGVALADVNHDNIPDLVVAACGCFNNVIRVRLGDGHGGFGAPIDIQVNGLSIPSVTSTLAAKLAQDKSIDWIVTLGAPIAMAALQSMQQAGRSSSVKLATFDLNADAAKAIQNGQIQFSVDQQPFLQGYLAVDALWANLVNGNDIGGGQPVLTGPSIVDKSNITKIAQYASRGTR